MTEQDRLSWIEQHLKCVITASLLAAAIVACVVRLTIGLNDGFGDVLAIFGVGATLVAVFVAWKIYRRQRVESKQDNKALSDEIVDRVRDGLEEAGERHHKVPPSAGRPSRLESLETKAILWVDDHPDWCAVERQVLVDLGARVVPVLSTDGGLDALRTRKYDLVLSDMDRGSPGRGDGLDLLERMRKEGVGTPVIFYTSSASPHDVERAVSAGAFAQTDNPWELVEDVQQALGV